MNTQAVTLGNFDGVHIGHRELLATTLQVAKKEKIPSLAITYHPNPAIVLGKKTDFAYLQTLEERKEQILQYGVDQVEVLEFNQELANMEAEEFLEKIILERFHASHIIIGFNHCFGKNRRGNTQLLQELAPKYNYQVYLVHPVSIQGQNVSSSLIRSWIREGKIQEANLGLGRLFSIVGKVVEGRKVGKTLGFPTANLVVPSDIVLPGTGVYATLTNGIPSVSNVGPRPTFGDGNLSFESHLLDWEGNLYGKKLKVEFLEKLRNTTQFRSPEELAHQIQKDIERAKQVFQNYFLAHPKAEGIKYDPPRI